MDASDRGAVIVEETQEDRVGGPVGRHLLRPLALEAATDVAVCGSHVSPEPDRPALVESLVAPGAGTLHEEDGPAVEQRKVRDHLLHGGVPLGIDAGPGASARGDELEDRIRRSGPDAVARGVAIPTTREVRHG